MNVSGIILIAFGIIYLINPFIFRRGFWMKTSIAINTMSPEKYKRYMQILAIVFIVAGLTLLAFEHLKL